MRALVVLAPGFEEVEAVTPIDFLRRGGVDVVIAGVGTRGPSGAHGIKIHTDDLVEDVQGPWDCVVLPGGMPGAENLAQSSALRELVQRVFAQGTLTGAICAAPAVVLGGFGLLEGRRFTCYPGFEERVKGGIFLEDRVVSDGNLITSRGPGTAAEFSCALVARLAGEKAAAELSQAVLLNLPGSS